MTVSHLIRSLGGPAIVGRALGIRSQAVSQWIRSNRIPIRRVPELLRFAERRKVRLSASAMRPDVDWGALR